MPDIVNILFLEGCLGTTAVVNKIRRGKFVFDKLKILSRFKVRQKMLSSTSLKKLLDSKEFDEFNSTLKKHYESTNKSEITSSQKVINLIAYHICTDKNLQVSNLAMLVQQFGQAVDVLTESDLQAESSPKAFDSFYHVSNNA